MNSRGAPLTAPVTAWPERDGGGLRSLVRELGPFTAFLAWLWLETVKQAHDRPSLQLPVYTLAAVYSVAFLAAAGWGQLLRPPGRVAVVAGLFVLGLTFPVLFGRPELLTLLAYGITASVVLLPLRAAQWLGFAAALALLGSTAVVRGAPDWSDTLLVGLLTMGIVSATQLTRANAQLRAAREQVRELAVAEERGRVARDLHDLLGHSLTTITLKTGLARRLLEGGKDGALDEVREVETLSRQALAEVRATVTDFRRTSLAAELAGVRAALGSAGIKLVAPHAVDDVEVRLQQPFAFVVREAVTNVIRHSGATRCEIRLGPNWIEVTDDGPAAASATVRGNGLSGLAERLAGVGGQIDAGPGPGGGFVVRASVG